MDHVRTAVEKVRGSVKLFSATTPPGKPMIGEAVVPVSQLTDYTVTRIVRPRIPSLRKHRIVSLNKSNPNAIAFDILRTKILRAMDQNGWRTLAVTSPTPQCGKTFVSINLSASISRQIERTVLLADFDLRAPRICQYLGLSVKLTLADYFKNGTNLGDILINPSVPRMVVLPTKPGIANPAELLGGVQVKNLVSELRNRYDNRVVVFDLPPLLTTDDPLAFLPNVDCVLLVAASGTTTKTEIEQSLQLLNGHNVVGTLLNKAREPGPAYGYGYGYGYGNKPKD